MKKWVFGISIFILLFYINGMNSPANKFGQLEKDHEIGYFQSNSTMFTIPQGTFIYELYFAEFNGRMKNRKCKVSIDGNKIKIEQTENTNLTGGKEIFNGLILKHQSGKWILTEEENDMNADEIGACTGIPIIEFDKKQIEWC